MRPTRGPDHPSQGLSTLIVTIWTSWLGGLETCIGNVDPMIHQGISFIQEWKVVQRRRNSGGRAKASEDTAAQLWLNPRDQTGSYNVVLLTFAPMFVASAIFFALARRPTLPVSQKQPALHA